MKSPSNKEVVIFFLGAIALGIGVGMFLAWVLSKLAN
jgi:ABC-type antimicrobial peptide transport system permease subunit|tara:strand:- start:2149 stop:2259 length:111 start_codon:yes stop_codon:yes gene_type:complete